MTTAHTLSELQTDAELGLSFRLRQPVPAQPTKCVILLHGVGGNETNLLDLADGLDPCTLVIFPRGPLQMGAQQFAWFRANFTSAGPSIVPEEAEHSRTLLIHFVQQVQTRYGVATTNTVIAGFSQGGILSASVALTTPEIVAGFGLLSGRILPELKPHVADKPRLAPLRAFVAHGDLDATLPVVWAQRSDQWLKELGVQNSSHRYPIGHSISAAMQADFLNWVEGLSQAA
jgi:phospholipase/carboxylesterase